MSQPTDLTQNVATRCATCRNNVGLWGPPNLSSGYTHIRLDGGPRWDLNKDHEVDATDYVPFPPSWGGGTMTGMDNSGETPTAKAERLAALTSSALGGPVGMADCGCPNRVDGGPPLLHICRSCGFVGGYASVHGECPGCDYRLEWRP